MSDELKAMLRQAPMNGFAIRTLAYIEKLEAQLAARCSAVSVDQQLEQAGKAAIAIRNELDRTRVERDSWEAQFHSAAAAASEYSEFWEKHRSDFDQFGNYIPYSQMDGDLRAAKAEIERLRALPQSARPWPKEEIEPGRFVDVDPEVLAAADKTEALRKQAFALSCHEQFRLASFVAENLGYVLSPDPLRGGPAEPPQCQAESAQQVTLDRKTIANAVEPIIIRRLFEKKVDGYTLPMSWELADAIVALTRPQRSQGE
jgi:hypothetical protein